MKQAATKSHYTLLKLMKKYQVKMDFFLVLIQALKQFICTSLILFIMFNHYVLNSLFFLYLKVALSEPVDKVLISVNQVLSSDEADETEPWKNQELDGYLAPMNLKVLNVFLAFSSFLKACVLYNFGCQSIVGNS